MYTGANMITAIALTVIAAVLVKDIIDTHSLRAQLALVNAELDN